ncbi:hypothetical protein [Peptoniphilus porci]|uniref:Response regulatory domain-containing protein n=1 Tax=Peptoniphilus porci TaxID=2652280 RepID=A0A1U7LX10_9FIRM|nr:hypothetical protein [Peptoniphilus porci]OLR61598.1 hypothetical protein BIV18_09595 [Peptoniphilus porci]
MIKPIVVIFDENQASKKLVSNILRKNYKYISVDNLKDLSYAMRNNDVKGLLIADTIKDHKKIIEQIRKIYPANELGIILLQSMDDKEEYKEELNIGFVKKPFQPTELSSSLKFVLSSIPLVEEDKALKFPKSKSKNLNKDFDIKKLDEKEYEELYQRPPLGLKILQSFTYAGEVESIYLKDSKFDVIKKQKVEKKKAPEQLKEGKKKEIEKVEVKEEKIDLPKSDKEEIRIEEVIEDKKLDVEVKEIKPAQEEELKDKDLVTPIKLDIKPVDREETENSSDKEIFLDLGTMNVEEDKSENLVLEVEEKPKEENFDLKTKPEEILDLSQDSNPSLQPQEPTLKTLDLSQDTNEVNKLEPNRPYDSTFDMYVDEHEDLEEEFSLYDSKENKGLIVLNIDSSLEDRGKEGQDMSLNRITIDPDEPTIPPKHQSSIDKVKKMFKDSKDYLDDKVDEYEVKEKLEESKNFLDEKAKEYQVKDKLKQSKDYISNKVEEYQVKDKLKQSKDYISNKVSDLDIEDLIKPPKNANRFEGDELEKKWGWDKKDDIDENINLINPEITNNDKKNKEKKSLFKKLFGRK